MTSARSGAGGGATRTARVPACALTRRSPTLLLLTDGTLWPPGLAGRSVVDDGAYLEAFRGSAGVGAEGEGLTFTVGAGENCGPGVCAVLRRVAGLGLSSPTPPMDRQVRLAAGTLALTSFVAGLIWPPVHWLSGAIGARLVFSGVTNTCGMAAALPQPAAQEQGLLPGDPAARGRLTRPGAPRSGVPQLEPGYCCAGLIRSVLPPGGFSRQDRASSRPPTTMKTSARLKVGHQPVCR